MTFWVCWKSLTLKVHRGKWPRQWPAPAAEGSSHAFTAKKWKWKWQNAFDPYIIIIITATFHLQLAESLWEIISQSPVEVDSCNHTGYINTPFKGKMGTAHSQIYGKYCLWDPLLHIGDVPRQSCILKCSVGFWTVWTNSAACTSGPGAPWKSDPPTPLTVVLP